MIYEYGPGAEGARRAAEASVLCVPTVGVLGCLVQRSLYSALAKTSVSELQGSLLQVVYDIDGHAEWVVFASTAKEMEKANLMIDDAESGDADVAHDFGRSFSLGSHDFPFDYVNAYKWLSIAAKLSATDAYADRDRIRNKLSSEDCARVREEVENWTPKVIR